MGTPSEQSKDYDHSFNITMIGDSGVGKSSLLVSFITGAVTDLPNAIGNDIEKRQITVDEKQLELSIRDTAGQEGFTKKTSLYCRDAHGIILVYDVTKEQTFTNLENFWTKEVERDSANKACVKILVGNKVDRESERVVSREEGMKLAKQNGFLFLESSALTRENVERCFEDLALKMLEELEKTRKMKRRKGKRKRRHGKKKRRRIIREDTQDHQEEEEEEDEEKKRQEEEKTRQEEEKKDNKGGYPGPPGGGGGGGGVGEDVVANFYN